jgi:hypothetical protein
VDPTATEVGFAYTMVEHTDHGSDPSNIVAALLVEHTNIATCVHKRGRRDCDLPVGHVPVEMGWQAGHTGLSLTTLNSMKVRKGKFRCMAQQGILYTVKFDGVQMDLPACP